MPIAALRERTDAVGLLLAHGAKVNAASIHGWTPLMAAAWEGHTIVWSGRESFPQRDGGDW